MDNKCSSDYNMFSNKIMESGIFPDSIRISQMIPLNKQGNINSLTNYGPISLLRTLSKAFVRVIFNQLYTYLDQNNNMNFE